MRYFVYILQSQVDSTYYIGFTTNLEARLTRHNSGRSRYTAKKRPWVIVYVEEFSTKAEALKRERFLKNQRNQEFYRALILSSAG